MIVPERHFFGGNLYLNDYKDQHICRFDHIDKNNAGVAKLVDALDLGSSVL